MRCGPRLGHARRQLARELPAWPPGRRASPGRAVKSRWGGTGPAGCAPCARRNRATAAIQARIAYRRFAEITVSRPAPPAPRPQRLDRVHRAAVRAECSTLRSGRPRPRRWPPAGPARSRAVSVSQSCGGPPSRRGERQPDVFASIGDDFAPREQPPMTAARSARSAPRRAARPLRRLDLGRRGGDPLGQGASAPHASSPGAARVCTWQPSGTRELGRPG